MADLHTYKKLPSDPCLTQEQITAYIDGNLSAAEQHACEKHIIDCVMCEDAVEGLALVKDRSLLAIPFVNGAAKAPAETEEKGKVVPLHQPNRKVWYAAAAILVVILGSAFLIKMMSGSDMGPLAENTSHKMDSISVTDEQNNITFKEPALADGRAADSNIGVPGGNGVAPASPKTQPIVVDGELSREDMNEGYAVTEAESPAEEMVMAPEVPALGNTYYSKQEADGDKNTKDGEDAVLKEKTENTKPEDTKKSTFWDRTKANIPATTNNSGAPAQRAEKQTLVTADKVTTDVKQDNNDDAAQKPTPDEVVVTTGPATNEPANANVSGGVAQSYDLYTDSGVNYSNTISVADSAKVGDNLELSYINGVNLLAAGQANAAITMFEKVLVNKEHPRYEDAEYQKAKALIKASRKEEAKTLLKAIEAKKGKHAAEATELLKTL